MDQGAEISQQVLFTFSDFVNYLSPRLPEVCRERERERDTNLLVLPTAVAIWGCAARPWALYFPSHHCI